LPALNFIKLFGNGKNLGLKLSYMEQPSPDGLAQAFIIGEKFIGDNSVAMILGDNIFYGNGLVKILQDAVNNTNRATIFGYYVSDPERFGVVEFDEHNKVVSVVEKPKIPKSNYAVTGLYFYDNRVVEFAKKVLPSSRGELEITDSIQKLIDMGKVVQSHILTGWWLDTGKKDDLLEANKIVLHDLLKQNCCGNIDKDTTMTGIVEVMAGSIVINSKLLGPVSIAENCKIINSTIGPCVSIGSGTTIENSAIEDSVILPECHIANIDLLKESVVGNGSTVIKNKDNSNLVRLFLGDVNRVEI